MTFIRGEIRSGLRPASCTTPGGRKTVSDPMVVLRQGAGDRDQFKEEVGLLDVADPLQRRQERGVVLCHTLGAEPRMGGGDRVGSQGDGAQ